MRKASRWLASAVVLAMTVFALPAVAQGPPAARPAHIHAGTCAERGEIVVPLSDLSGTEGELLGSGEATVAQSSYTQVPLALTALLAGEYAIDIHVSADGETLACGEIGGTLDASGALSIGLRPSGNSGFSGIAYLTPGGGATQTGISAFLAETGAGASAGAATGGTRAPGVAAADEQRTYVTTVRRQVTLLVGSLERVNALFDEPQTGDDAWIGQLSAELTLWQMLYEEAQEIARPAEAADFHDRYLEALALLDSAALDIFSALENGDQQLLAEAGAKIDQAIQAIRALDAADDAGTPAAWISLPQ